MKTTRSLIRFCIVLLALVLLLALLTLPVLAKGVAAVKGDEVQPEKLDIKPIPVPTPRLPAAATQPQGLATPSPSSALAPVPQPIPVPTPPVSAHTETMLVQPSRTESPTALMIPLIDLRGIIATALTSLILLIWGWFHRETHLHCLHEECA